MIDLGLRHVQMARRPLAHAIDCSRNLSLGACVSDAPMKVRALNDSNISIDYVEIIPKISSSDYSPDRADR